MKRGVTGTINLSSIISTMKNAIFFNSSSGFSSGLSRWMNLNASVNGTNSPQSSDPTDITNTSPERATLMPCAGTLKNLYIYLQNNGSVIGDYIFTLYVNGVATGVAITLPGDGSNLPVLVSNTSTSFPINAGDLVALLVDYSTIVAGDSAFAGAIEFDT